MRKYNSHLVAMTSMVLSEASAVSSAAIYICMCVYYIYYVAPEVYCRTSVMITSKGLTWWR
jgi:hypothetical protein